MLQVNFIVHDEYLHISILFYISIAKHVIFKYLYLLMLTKHGIKQFGHGQNCLIYSLRIYQHVKIRLFNILQKCCYSMPGHVFYQTLKVHTLYPRLIVEKNGKRSNSSSTKFL